MEQRCQCSWWHYPESRLPLIEGHAWPEHFLRQPSCSRWQLVQGEFQSYVVWCGDQFFQIYVNSLSFSLQDCFRSQRRDEAIRQHKDLGHQVLVLGDSSQVGGRKIGKVHLEDISQILKNSGRIENLVKDKQFGQGDKVQSNFQVDTKTDSST